MQNFLSNKNLARVLVVEPASSVRLMLSELLRSFGFKDVIAVASCKDALAILEIETVHWLIMPLLPNGEVNAFHLLDIISQNAALRHIQTSLLVDSESELNVLTPAFEMGLMSWHKKSYVKEDFQRELEELFSLLELNQWHPALTAAEYLRGVLTQLGHHESRIALEQNLLSLFPGSSKVLLALAEAELARGQIDKGRRDLAQAELIDERLRVHCKRLRMKYSIPEIAASSDKSARVENLLGLKLAVVIDPDTDVLHAARGLLEGVGVANIETFEDGDLACEWLKSSPEPDLILMEWRLPKLSGPLFVQRIRQDGFIQVPILVMSSLVKKEDAPLLREMECNDVLEKPFDSSHFYAAIVSVIQEDRGPAEQKSLQRKIRQMLQVGKTAEAERLIAQILGDARVPEGAKKEVTAEYEFSKGNFRLAADLGAEALQKGGDTLHLLNLIGKSFLHLKRYKPALSCFEKAQSISPMNIERLLKISEIHNELKDVTGSKKALEKASSIDQDNPLVVESKVIHEIEHGKKEMAQPLMRDLDSGKKIVSYMNNRAISLTRAGRFEEAIALYKRTVAAAPDKWADVKKFVKYNLALAYARYADFSQAKAVLLETSPQDEQLARKVQSLLRKVERFEKTGQPVFNAADPTDNIDETEVESEDSETTHAEHATDFTELVLKVEARRGDIGCFMIYRCIEGHDPNTADLLKKKRTFNARTAIKKAS